MDYLVYPLLIAAGVFLLWLAFKILKTPIKWAFKLLLHIALGFVGLVIFNFIGGFVGLSLAINWFTAAVTGILGVPGVILLLLIKYLL